jgi:hypothetical protein
MDILFDLLDWLRSVSGHSVGLPLTLANDPFGSKADNLIDAPQCPLMTRSGPERLRLPCKLSPESHFAGRKFLL